MFIYPYRQPVIIPYNRDRAVEYAHKWAFGRNPAYFDFEKLGGDCTNFASQCIYAGSGVMNHTPVNGWYYYSSNNRTPSWTGVNYLYDFLTRNTGAGPFAEIVDVSEALPGDIAQLSFEDKYLFNHSPVIIQAGNPVKYDNILIAAHTYNADNYVLNDFGWSYARIIHIIGVRV